MSSKLILIIDDDETLLELLAEHIQSAGYHTLTANNGQQGLQLALDDQPDLVVLDVMMPSMDGWEVLIRLRENSSVPIILLTAKGDEIDKLHGFRKGADDYITKPFSFAELTARASAILARTQRAKPAQQLTSGNLSIDFNQRRVSIDGKIVELSPTEYRLLEVLARNIHRTVSTEHILSKVWGSQYTGENEHVKRYIWTLRKKIEHDPGDPQHILTERGFGYRLT